MGVEIQEGVRVTGFDIQNSGVEGVSPLFPLYFPPVLLYFPPIVLYFPPFCSVSLDFPCIVRCGRVMGTSPASTW